MLAFEESMGLKPITVSEAEFHSINNLREYSLLKFYNTASKSLYSFVCQNVHFYPLSTSVSGTSTTTATAPAL